MKKGRGKFLTIMLVLSAIGLLQSLYYLVNTDLIQQSYGVVPEWFQLYSVFGIVFGMIMITGLWMMKKWGVYLLAVSVVLSFVMQLFFMRPLAYQEVVYIMSIASAGIWFWAINRKWKYFT
jgi:hypothetical protein